MSDTATSRTEREDFQATSDPALLESADRGEVQPAQLRAALRAVGAPAVAHAGHRLHPGPLDWERLPRRREFQRMYGLSSFFIGEQRVAEELGPMMRAAPTEEMRIFLCTQIADEARHVAFFNRFYEEVGVLESDNLQDRLEETSAHLNPKFHELFDEMLSAASTSSRATPSDLETLVEAITLYHMVIEGMLALTGQHFIISYNEEHGHAARLRGGLQQRRPRRAPARGLRRALPARDGAGRPEVHARRSSAR